MKRIGVLGVQGAAAEHMDMLSQVGVFPVKVRYKRDFDGLSGLVIPGGESTTMRKLIIRQKLVDPILQMANMNKPILGTCAGLILLAQKIMGESPSPIGILDVQVQRNASGRQSDSFETYLNVESLGEEPFKSVFIRAPYITKVGPKVKVTATFKDDIVAVQQNNILACSFHPELTNDTRMHSYFVSLTT